MASDEAAVISSRRSVRAARLDAVLRGKKARDETGLFALEGRRLCVDAARVGVPIVEAFATPAAVSRYPDDARLLSGAAGGLTLLADELAARIGETKTSQGFFLLCQKPCLAEQRLHIEPAGGYLLLYRVRDPGNLGSILRTAAALGAAGVLLCDCTELFSPKTLRAAMGGAWRVPVAVCEDIIATIGRLRRAGVLTLAGALRPDAPGPRALAGGGRAILIGNEAEGLPEHLIDACHSAVTLPMHAGSDSLGAAVAAGILLWEMLKGN